MVPASPPPAAKIISHHRNTFAKKKLYAQKIKTEIQEVEELNSKAEN